MSSHPIIEVVGAAIVRDDGRILAARRGPEMALAGKWEFPGGKIESGESAEECLVREIEEELGIGVEVLDFIERGTSKTASGRTVQLDVYRCRWTSGALEPVEHDRLEWVAPNKLAALDWAEADLPAVGRLRA